MSNSTMTDTNEEGGNRWSLQEEMEKVFKTALERSFPDLSDEEDPYILMIENKEIGDYECNNVSSICLDNPPETMLLKRTAEAIKNNLPPNDMIEDCSIQSIGFLTFRLSRKWIAKKVHKMLDKGIETWAPKLPMKTAIVNFPSQNLAREMDVGHLRPAIIGDMLARMLEFSNVNVQLINHNHFVDRMELGMLIEPLLENFDEGQNIGEFEVFYKESKRRFDEDAEFRERAHHALLGLQAGDRACLHALKYICDKNRIFSKVSELLGIQVDETSEYYNYPHNQETLNILRREEGLIEESEGDQVIFVKEKKTTRHRIFERKKKPLTVVKKNGVHDNALADLTVLRCQLKEKKTEWVVYVADVGKKEYIEMCFSAARRAGWLPSDEDEYPGTKFVGYGLVQGDDSFRSGNLVDLLDGARTRCKAALLERVKGDELTAEELEYTAEALGHGAVKYALMKDCTVFNYTLNVDEMLSDKGNTGVYLLYTHAQICSIINESGKDIEELKKTRQIILEKDEERELGLHLLQFTEVLELTCTTVLSSNLCGYLYELSKKFTSFYSVVHQAVGGADEEANRLLVCEATRVVMTKCFHLLGITPLGKLSMTTPSLAERDDADTMESFSSDEDTEEKVSTRSSSGKIKEDILSSSSGEEKTPVKRFKSSDQTLEEEMKMTPSLEPESSGLTLEEEKDRNPRFQLFSVHVHVDIYGTDCKPCFLFGSITVSDMFVSSEENGWVPTYDPEYGYTDLLYRDWSKPIPIVNDGYINALTHPRTHRSIPFIDFLYISAEIRVFSKDDNILFHVSDAYTCLGLSNVTYDKFSTQVLHGHDGLVKLAYIVLSDPVDAALDMTLFSHSPAGIDVFNKPLSVKIFAHYGGDYGSSEDRYYITLLEDDYVTMFDKAKIPLNTSVLAVPANGSLVIDVVIKDSNKNVIVEKIFHFSAGRKGSSDIDFDQGGGCSLNMKVNWR